MSPRRYNPTSEWTDFRGPEPEWDWAECDGCSRTVGSDELVEITLVGPIEEDTVRPGDFTREICRDCWYGDYEEACADSSEVAL